MNKDELGRRLFVASNIKGHFILRSGQEASEYFDKYLFEADPVLLRSIAKHMAKLLPAQFDKLAGLEIGGIPVSTALSLESGYQTLFVRKKAKSRHGREIVRWAMH